MWLFWYFTLSLFYTHFVVSDWTLWFYVEYLTTCCVQQTKHIVSMVVGLTCEMRGFVRHQALVRCKEAHRMDNNNKKHKNYTRREKLSVSVSMCMCVYWCIVPHSRLLIHFQPVVHCSSWFALSPLFVEYQTECSTNSSFVNSFYWIRVAYCMQPTVKIHLEWDFWLSRFEFQLTSLL